MSALKLSMQDKKDLDKFTKFLALKAAQIIVQSRSGEKVSTKCKPNSSGTDWVRYMIYLLFFLEFRISILFCFYPAEEFLLAYFLFLEFREVIFGANLWAVTRLIRMILLSFSIPGIPYGLCCHASGMLYKFNYYDNKVVYNWFLLE